MNTDTATPLTIMRACVAWIMSEDGTQASLESALCSTRAWLSVEVGKDPDAIPEGGTLFWDRGVGPCPFTFGEIFADVDLLAESYTTSSLLATTAAESSRVAALGCWPAWLSPDSLTSRVPTDGGTAPGFDAGIACCLDIIPRKRQALAAGLHAAYTPALVAQVISEMEKADPDSESVWWLAMCSVCKEGDRTEEDFLQQVTLARTLAQDSDARVLRAVGQLLLMRTYCGEAVFGDVTVPCGTVDGCIQGAYLQGHRFGVHYHESFGLWFIGTYESTLGLEDFSWAEATDGQGRPTSGPVFGSRQFVKCATVGELTEALKVVVAHTVEVSS